MRRSEQDASYTRRVIMQLHRPVKLKLRRTIFLNFLRPLVLSDRRDFFGPGAVGLRPAPVQKTPAQSGPRKGSERYGPQQ